MNSHLFQNEIMTCSKCGWQFQAVWNIESMWTALRIDDKPPIYICPSCWGVPRKLWPEEVREKWDEDHPTKKG